MSHRTLLSRASSLPFLPLLAALSATAMACGGSSSSSSGSPPGPTTISVARSNAARTPASSVPAGDMKGAVGANNAFAVDLYAHERAAATSPGNLLTSPISASLALTMTYAGAAGSTATGMAQALHLGSAASTVFAGQNALDQALASRAASALAADQQNAKYGNAPAPSPSDYDLTVVNSVWGEKTYPWAAPFLNIMATDYGTGVYLEDFVTAYDQARQSINGWVSDQTSDKINDLLPPGSLDDSTRMVLVNAIHLKLPWANPFQASATASASFTRADGSKVTTPFMNEAQTFGYVDDGQAQIVSLPLAGGQETVVIALPHGDLSAYEAKLTASSAALVPPAGQAEVSLSLPKVAFTTPTFSLAKSLQAMGMTDAFDPHTADFSGLCPNTPDHARLYVSDVLQKAMLGMQETGVEAAAATAVVVAGTSVELQPVTMTVDRPFLVSIVDVPTGAVLFLGHIEDPTATGN